MSEVLILTNDILKSLMPDAMVFRGFFTGGCLEDFTQNGIYRLQGDASGWTTLYTPPFQSWHVSLLEVISRSGKEDITQRLTNPDTGQTYVRVRRLGVWKPWYKLDMTLVE